MKKLTAIIVLLLALLLVCSACGKDSFKSFTEETGIEIVGIEAYSGPYVEDGSDEAVENVMQLTVKNTSQHNYQLICIALSDKQRNTYSFKLTSLLAGESMVVLEENRAEFSDDIKLVSASAGDTVRFIPAPDMHTDTVAVSAEDGAVLVYNLSGEELNDLYVYYKNYHGDTAFGGITYRVGVPTLPAGESAEVPAAHMSGDISKLVFVTYGD